MSPISTAHLNPQNLNFCLSPSTGFVLIPIVLNNTNLSGLKYSVTPLGFSETTTKGKIEIHDLTLRDLKVAEQVYQEKSQAAIQTGPARNAEDYDEYDDDDGEDTGSQDAHSKLQKSQSLVHIMLSRPGIVRLERVYDTSFADARLVVSEAVIVPCPQVVFAKDEGTAQEPIRCVGQDPTVQLKIKVHGVPPLSLRWLRTINGAREQYLVEGIEGDHQDDHTHRKLEEAPSDPSAQATLGAISRVPAAQDVAVPLTVTLDQPGTYLYALEVITDGVGNTIRVGIEAETTATDSLTMTKTTRAFMVLQKPAVSFSHCSTDTPVSLLIGSESSIKIRSIQVDPFDVPLDLDLKYQPPTEDGKGGKKLKAWKKTLKLQGDDKSLTFRVNTPGEYKIAGVKGKVGIFFFWNSFTRADNVSSQ